MRDVQAHGTAPGVLGAEPPAGPPAYVRAAPVPPGSGVARATNCGRRKRRRRGLRWRLRGRPRYNRRVGLVARAQLQLFRELRSLDEETKARLRPHVCHYQTRIAKARLRPKKGVRYWALAVVRWLVWYYVANVVFLVPVAIAADSSARIAAWWNSDAGDTYTLLVALAGPFLVNAAWKRWRQWRRPHLPDAEIVAGLQDLLVLVERAPARQWQSLALRRGVALRIERVATTVERELPRLLRSGDRLTDVWLHETTEQMAAALRGYKKAILVPTTDTRAQLAGQLARTLEQVASGRWEQLERAEPATLTAAQLRRFPLLSVMSLGRSALPKVVVPLMVVGVLALQAVTTRPHLLQSTGSVWVGIGVALLLTLCDPAHSSIGYLKDLTALPLFPRNS